MPLHPTARAHDAGTAMDITKYIADYREAAFLVGDYSSYRTQLSRRLRIVRKKLGRATAKNAKYAAKAPVTAEDVAKNVEYE
jgi:signal recognition particle subunit SRP68